MIRIDLKNEDLFEVDELNVDRKVTFVYGKNGTGKSTLTRILRQQVSNYDVRVFQNFDQFLGTNHRLNAVVLGEENEKIEHQIEELSEKRKRLEHKKDQILKMVEQPSDPDVENFWTKLQYVKKQYEDKEGEITSLMRNGAADIKRIQNPPIAKTNYNIRDFQQDMEEAEILTEEQRSVDKKLLRATVKSAKNILIPAIDLNQLQEEVEKILQNKVEEKIIIERIGKDNERREFARKGLKMHKAGDICAFCGGLVSENVVTELNKYFSKEDINNLQDQIQEKINKIQDTIQEIHDCKINEDEFYPEYNANILSLKEKLEKCKSEYDCFLQELLKVLIEKKMCLFESVSLQTVKMPSGIENIIEEYDCLKEENNANELESKQEEAKRRLRLHEVKKTLVDHGYEAKMAEKRVLSEQRQKREHDLQEQLDIIDGNQGLNFQIETIDHTIEKLQEKTVSETALADNINNKLDHMVSFKLKHCQDEKGKGYYQVQGTKTGELRDITEVSTGEKNIIAFLYFVEKLNEVQPASLHKPKCVVFDDPMNSNDDNMQYLIMAELQKLMRTLGDNDHLVILTHNKHFYLNVKYPFMGRDFSKARFWRMTSKGGQTSVEIIQNGKDDFKTSYEALWKELAYLYNADDVSEDMLLNPMRRIVETFVKFNALKMSDFLSIVDGAEKLLNVNSHSIDDLEADLCGQTKQQVMRIFCDCFTKNHYGEHLERYWDIRDETGDEE